MSITAPLPAGSTTYLFSGPRGCERRRVSRAVVELCAGPYRQPVRSANSAFRWRPTPRQHRRGWMARTTPASCVTARSMRWSKYGTGRRRAHAPPGQRASSRSWRKPPGTPGSSGSPPPTGEVLPTTPAHSSLPVPLPPRNCARARRGGIREQVAGVVDAVYPLVIRASMEFPRDTLGAGPLLAGADTTHTRALGLRHRRRPDRLSAMTHRASLWRCGLLLRAIESVIDGDMTSAFKATDSS